MRGVVLGARPRRRRRSSRSRTATASAARASTTASAWSTSSTSSQPQSTRPPGRRSPSSCCPGSATVHRPQACPRGGCLGGPDRHPLHRGRRLDPALRGGAGTRHGDGRLPHAVATARRPRMLAQQARIMVDAGAQCVYVVDSAGALVLSDAQERVRPSSTRSARRGAGRLPRPPEPQPRRSRTRCSPTRPGRCRSTARCAPSAPAPATRRPRCSPRPSSGWASAPASTSARCCRPPRRWCARSSRGCRGWIARRSRRATPASTRSFLLHAERAAERYGVPAHEILQKVGEHGYVGGQEDMIIDIALQLAEEKASGDPDDGRGRVMAADTAGGPGGRLGRRLGRGRAAALRGRADRSTAVHRRVARARPRHRL